MSFRVQNLKKKIKKKGLHTFSKGYHWFRLVAIISTVIASVTKRISEVARFSPRSSATYAQIVLLVLL